MERRQSPLTGYIDKRAKGGVNLSDTNKKSHTPEEDFFGEDADIIYQTTAGEIHKKFDIKEAELKSKQEESQKAEKAKTRAKLKLVKEKDSVKSAEGLKRAHQQLESTYTALEQKVAKGLKDKLPAAKFVSEKPHLRLVTTESDISDKDKTAGFTELEEKFFAEGKERAWRGELGFELENDEPIEIKVGDLKPPSEVGPKVEKEKPKKAA